MSVETTAMAPHAANNQYHQGQWLTAGFEP